MTELLIKERKMKIGIDASRAFVKQRTGIEEYAYQIISNFRHQLEKCEVFLYVRKRDFDLVDFPLPANWNVKPVPYRYFWTQIGLSWELLTNPVDVLFVPAHTVPIVHPRDTVVTVHGLEYEHCPESYSGYSKAFHGVFVKKSCQWAKVIVAVSNNTKKDLVGMYGIEPEKIKVVYNGVDENFKKQASSDRPESKKFFISEFGSFVLFVGRLEKRKNIIGIVQAFEILKGKFGYDGKLILVGKPGFGIGEIRDFIKKNKFQEDIIEFGFASEEQREELLANADVFLFPSLCEGFGIPILEAQSLGTPVVTSNIGPLDEVAGNTEILVDPKNFGKIAELADKIIRNDHFAKDVSRKGLKNVMRFSWEKSASETAKILLSFFGGKRQ